MPLSHVLCESTHKLLQNDAHIIYFQERQWDLITLVVLCCYLITKTMKNTAPSARKAPDTSVYPNVLTALAHISPTTATALSMPTTSILLRSKQCKKNNTTSVSLPLHRPKNKTELPKTVSPWLVKAKLKQLILLSGKMACSLNPCPLPSPPPSLCPYEYHTIL